MTIRAVLVGAALALGLIVGGQASAATDTFTHTASSTATSTATRTSTASRTATATRTATASRTSTATSTGTIADICNAQNPAITCTATRTPTTATSASATHSRTRTESGTRTASRTRTATSTATRSATATASRTRTATRTDTRTSSNTRTATQTWTLTGSLVATQTSLPCGVPAQDSLCQLVELQRTAAAGGGIAPAPAYPPVPTSTAIYYTITCDLTPVSVGTADAGRISMRLVPDGGTSIGYASTAALAISDGQPVTNQTGHTLERVDGCTQQIFVVSRDGTAVPVRVKVVRYP